LDAITRNGNQSGVMLSLEDCQAMQDTAGLCRCRLDREMVERINKLIKEVQPSFGLVSGSQRLLTSPGGQSKTATRVETGIDSLRSAFAAD
jgi:hypothetical protein